MFKPLTARAFKALAAIFALAASHTHSGLEGGGSARRHKLSSEEREVRIFCASSPQGARRRDEKNEAKQTNKKIIPENFVFFLLLERSICFNIQINAVDGFALTIALGDLKKKERKNESIILREQQLHLAWLISKEIFSPNLLKRKEIFSSHLPVMRRKKTHRSAAGPS